MRHRLPPGWLERAHHAPTAAVRERLPYVQAEGRPTVNLSDTTRSRRDASTAYTGDLDYEAAGAALSISQPLFRLADKAATEVAEAQVEQVENQSRSAEQDLLLRVAPAYFDVLQTQDELAAATAQKDALSLQLAQARRSLEVGTVPVTDFNEAQTRFDPAVAQEIAARNELASRRRVLEKRIAQPLPGLARLTDTADIDLISPAGRQELVDAAPRTSLQGAAGRSALEAARREVECREAGHTPTLDLVATLRRDRNVNHGQFGGNDTCQATIGIELNVPLSQGGLASSRTREAIAELLRSEQDLINAERQATLDAQQAQLGVELGSALTRALRQAPALAETQLRSTQRGLQVGVRTRVDVLNAEQQLFVTRKDLAAARFRTLLAGLQLRAAAGQPTESDLRGLDALLVN